MQLKAVFFDVGGTLETYRSSPGLRLENTYHFRECLSKAGICMDENDEVTEVCTHKSAGSDTVDSYQVVGTQVFHYNIGYEGDLPNSLIDRFIIE